MAERKKHPGGRPVTIHDRKVILVSFAEELVRYMDDLGASVGGRPLKRSEVLRASIRGLRDAAFDASTATDESSLAALIAKNLRGRRPKNIAENS
jgi:Arc/MetJ-type ribon-helix-helix transcriptional regulator